MGFNLPFDLSRLAMGVKEARRSNFGGISLILSEPKAGSAHREQRHRPRVIIKHLDSKGAFISFTKPMEPDEADLIPEEGTAVTPDPSYAWRGRFLDLRTLAFALSGECLHPRRRVQGLRRRGQGRLRWPRGDHTSSIVDYCRQDVAATAALYEALIDEFQPHPVDLEPERAYSPASLSKAYLAAMGIAPLLERHPDFPPEVLGYAMAAFYGGRAECRIRRVPVPVAWSTSPLCTRRSTLSWTSTGSRSPRRSRSTTCTEQVDRPAGRGHAGGLLRSDALAPAGRLRPGPTRR